VDVRGAVALDHDLERGGLDLPRVVGVLDREQPLGAVGRDLPSSPRFVDQALVIDALVVPVLGFASQCIGDREVVGALRVNRSAEPVLDVMVFAAPKQGGAAVAFAGP
jgi:hypothetical protein